MIGPVGLADTISTCTLLLGRGRAAAVRLAGGEHLRERVAGTSRVPARG